MKRLKENKPATKKPFYKTFIGSLVTIIGICIVFYFIFFASLASITGHGDELKVPNLTGKTIGEVHEQLKEEGFGLVIDSTYNPELPPFTIIDQQPLAGNTVKPGRHIYLTINKSVPPNSSMPNLINLSLRSALLVLKSNKLLLGDTTIQPDMALGAIVAQNFNGSPITAGTAVPQGSKIDLIIGGGFQAAKVAVPDVINLTFEVATSIISASNLNFDVIWEGPITDSASAIVYSQLPMGFDEEQEPIMIEQGSTIDIKVRQNP